MLNTLFAFAGPSRTTYQAKIIKPDGYPLEASVVNFKFTMLDPAGSCMLYSETFSGVNMGSSAGLVSFSLGSGVRTFPVSGSTFEQVFSNTTASLTCDAGGPGTYSPLSTDTRKIVMQFNDGGGWQTLPAMTINAVPYAMYANDSLKFNGKDITEFVQVASLPTCTASQAMSFNGAGFSCLAVGGTSTSVTSGAVLTALGYTPANGASVTTIAGDVSSVSSTVFTVVGSVTSLQNSVAASFAAITSSQWLASGTSISYQTGNVGIGTTTPVTKLDVSGGVRIGAESTTCAPVLAGTLRYNASNVEYCNGTSWQAFGVSGSGITNFNGSTSGTQSFATGTGGTAPNINTLNGVHTLNLPLANTGSVTAGLISNTDYTTFTNKITSSAASIAQVLGYTPADNSVSGTYAQKANNLSDLTNVATARTNLGLGTFATASSIDLGSASATGTVAIARLPSFTGDATIAAASNTIMLSNSGVTAGTYTKVTVDAKGRVTSGAQIASSDVTTALGYTPASASASTQWTTSGNIIYYNTGNVGIGTTNPTANLEVSGTIKISGGVPGSGKVLTSDASGAATWQTPAASSSFGDFKADGSVSMTGVFLGIDGNQTTPAISFASDPDTGIARVGPNSLNFVTGGAYRVNLDAAGLSSSNVFGWYLNPVNGSATTPNFSWLFDADTGMYRTAADTLAFATSGVERLRISSSGNVGIGTSSPVTRLEVSGGVRISMESATCVVSYAGTLRYNSGNVEYCNGTSWSSFGGAVTSASVISALGYTPVSSAAASQWTTSATTINYSGKVGIGTGTTDPTTPLQVAGPINATPSKTSSIFSTLSAASTGIFMGSFNASPWGSWIQSADHVGFVSYPLILNPNGANVGIGLSNPGSRLVVKGLGATSATSSLNVTDSSDNSHLFVRGDGNVGIGTTSPGQQLDVSGTVQATKFFAASGAFNSPAISFASATTTGFYNNGGNLGISIGGGLKGTWSANSLGFNAGGAGPQIYFTGGNAAAPSYAFNVDSDTGMFNPNASGGSNELGFSTAGAERLRISSVGNVGIGTSAPSQKLEVASGSVVFNANSDSGNYIYLGGPGSNSKISTGGSNDWIRLDSGFNIQLTSANINMNAPVVDINGKLNFKPGTAPDYTTDDNLTDIYYGNDYATPMTFSGRAKSATQFIFNRKIASSTGQLFSVLESGTSRFTIDSSGNVGLGTTTPVAKLDVSGAIRISDDQTACSSANKGAMRFNQSTNIFEMCDGISWNTSASADLIPASSIVLMSACPAGWTNNGLAAAGGQGAVTCNGITCSLCQAPSASLVPANSNMLMESCPSGWTTMGKAAGPGRSGYTLGGSIVDFVNCQSPAIGSVMPKGSRLIMQFCPAAWNDLGDTGPGQTLATCGAIPCRVCEVPGGVASPRVLYGGTASSSAITGSEVSIIGGRGGSTSGSGGPVYIRGGMANEGIGGAVFINAGAASTTTNTSYAGASIQLTAGNGVVSGMGGVISLSAGASADGTYEDIELQPYGGRVGIGTTNAEQRLHVTGNSMLFGSLQTNISAYASGGIRLTGNGGASQEAISFWGGNSGGGAAIAFRRDDNLGSYLDFYTNNTGFGNITHAATLNNLGNFGIGTTTPVTKLEVSGGVRISMESATCAASYAGTLRYNSGNLEMCNGTSWSAFGMADSGITAFNGSTSGSQTFANGATGTAPLFVTTNGVHTLNIPLASVGSVTAGLLSNIDYATFTNKITSSSASIAQVLGYTPAASGAILLADLTDAYTNSNDSIFIGAGTPQSGTTFNNTALGVRALALLTNGSENVAIGNGSLYSNTSGYANTAIGWESLSSNTTGGNNTSVGNESMAGNTTGFSNTGLGSWALYRNTTGYFNTAIGEASLDYNNSGNRNVALGATAGRRNSVGSDNIFIGFAAGEGQGPGTSDVSGSTLVGMGAGRFIQTGANYNTLIGYKAADNITTGSNNIVIGNNIDAVTATASGTLNIGNLIFGTNLNGQGTTISTGNVGIGTAVPLTSLHVAGTATFHNATGSSYNENIRLPAANNDYASIALGSSSTATGGTVAGQWTLVRFPAAGFNNLFSIRGNSTDHFAITASGSVGIGTITPSAQLHVGQQMAAPGTSGTVNRIVIQPYGHTGGPWRMNARDFGADAFLDFDYGAANIMTFEDSGKVGIGTSNPSTRFHVADGTNSLIFMSSTQAALSILKSDLTGPYAYVIGKAQSTNNTANFRYNHVADGSTSNYVGMGFWNNDDLLNLKATGQVGIGTTNPQATLHVSGTARIADGTQAAGRVLASDASGNASWKQAIIHGTINSTANSSTSGGAHASSGVSITLPPGRWQISGMGITSAASCRADFGVKVQGGGVVKYTLMPVATGDFQTATVVAYVDIASTTTYELFIASRGACTSQIHVDNNLWDLTATGVAY